MKPYLYVIRNSYGLDFSIPFRKHHTLEWVTIKLAVTCLRYRYLLTWIWVRPSVQHYQWSFGSAQDVWHSCVIQGYVQIQQHLHVTICDRPITHDIDGVTITVLDWNIWCPWLNMIEPGRHLTLSWCGYLSMCFSDAISMSSLPVRNDFVVSREYPSTIPDWRGPVSKFKRGDQHSRDDTQKRHKSILYAWDV